METEILSEKELAELTGYKARGHQRRWLAERHWHFVESRGGRPLVGRQYAEAPDELKDAMDLAYLTGQRPSDVLSMRKDDMEGIYLLVSQGKTGKRLRIVLEADDLKNSLGLLLERIMRRTREHLSPFFIVNEHGKRMSWPMLRNRWADAREAARVKAELEKKPDLANRIAQFQFRDIRPKAASEINDLSDASVLLGHSKEEITERVYRRVGAIAKPSKG